MNEVITINEVNNDGKYIHLYFNGLVGLYTAYGYSAFNLSKEAVINAAYSENMQMPVVVINREHLEKIIKNLTVEKQKNGYYCLVYDKDFDEKEYAAWAGKLRLGGV